MSQRIARLLEESEAAVTKVLQELEEANGLPGHDVRHIADTHQAIREKLTDLGLDPSDTTAEELHHALLVKFENDSRNFDESYGVSNAGFDDRIALAAKLLHHSGHMPQTWALKNSAAKDLLRRLPPKHAMKALRYRSVESLLKRENIAEVILAAQMLESGTWHNRFSSAVSKLDQTAFELREIRLVSLPASKWMDAVDGYEVSASAEEAAVAVWPTENNADQPLLSVILAVTEELESFGARFKLDELFEDDNVIAWWSDMDHFVAELEGGNVSLNLRDINQCLQEGVGFTGRSTLRGRREYWHELMQKYQKKAGLQEIFDSSAIQKVRQLKLKAPQPAYEFEFAEEAF